MPEKPLILVTNDDGAGAKGLQALLKVVRPLGIVYAVVPAEPHSGMSHAITVSRPVHVDYREDLSGGDYYCYTVSGTPVDCIKLAINRLLPRRPDLVVSGINHGSNASVNLIYSGTMGAALEGAVNGIRSIGLSLLSFDSDADFSSAIHISETVIRQVLANGYRPGLCLNVNIPIPDDGNIKGIRICRQTKGYWSEEFEEATGENGEKGYLLRGFYHNLEPDASDTDQWALEQGYAAIVPVDADHTRYDDLQHLSDLNMDLSPEIKRTNHHEPTKHKKKGG